MNLNYVYFDLIAEKSQNGSVAMASTLAYPVNADTHQN